MEQIKRISFSELKNWTECPYRHKLIYIDKLPYFSGNEFTAFGTAIHTVCEKVIPGEPLEPLKVFEEAFLEELELLKDSGYELNKTLITEMRNQAKPICDQVIPAVRHHFGDSLS